MWSTSRHGLILLSVMLTAAVALAVSGCGSTRGAAKAGRGYSERGLASWYGPGFHGRQSASGEIYDMNALTAAHRTLPFDTIVEVRNRDNGRRVEVRITDRGPFVRGRIIDLSHEAARRLEMLGPGVARVELRVLRSAADATPGGSYWVQVGAFRDPAEARQFYRRIQRDFGAAQLSSDGDWHRVRVGPFSKRKRADSTLRELQRLGIEAFVVRL